MTREVSAEGRALIQQFEGLSLTAYRCPAGKWTIGYGHTAGVQFGDQIARDNADDLLRADLASCGNAVDEALGGCPASRHEFDAMVSLAFNVGVAGFKGSTVLRLHRQGDRQGAARAFGLWNKAMVDGRLQEIAGLTRRRAAETAFYLTEDAPGLKDMPQAVAPPGSVATSRSVIAGSVTVAAGAASAADQVTPVLNSIATAGASLKGVMQLGGATLSIIAVAGAAYMLWRYIHKRRRGEILS